MMIYMIFLFVKFHLGGIFGRSPHHSSSALCSRMGDNPSDDSFSTNLSISLQLQGKTRSKNATCRGLLCEAQHQRKGRQDNWHFICSCSHGHIYWDEKSNVAFCMLTTVLSDLCIFSGLINSLAMHRHNGQQCFLWETGKSGLFSQPLHLNKCQKMNQNTKFLPLTNFMTFGQQLSYILAQP